MAVVKELPLKKIKPLPIQTQRGTPPPPPPPQRAGRSRRPAGGGGSGGGASLLSARRRLSAAPGSSPPPRPRPWAASSCRTAGSWSSLEPGEKSAPQQRAFPISSSGQTAAAPPAAASGGAPHAEPRPSPASQARLRRKSTLSAIHLKRPVHLTGAVHLKRESTLRAARAPRPFVHSGAGVSPPGPAAPPGLRRPPGPQTKLCRAAARTKGECRPRRKRGARRWGRQARRQRRRRPPEAEGAEPDAFKGAGRGRP